MLILLTKVQPKKKGKKKKKEENASKKRKPLIPVLQSFGLNIDIIFTGKEKARSRFTPICYIGVEKK